MRKRDLVATVIWIVTYGLIGGIVSACVSDVADAIVGNEDAVDTVTVSTPPDTVTVVWYCVKREHHRWVCRPAA